MRFVFFLAILQNHILPNTQPIGYGRVEFFFVLTGFLLSYLSSIEITNTGRFSIKNAFIRRVLRIYPLYYLALLFSFFVLPFIGAKLGFDVSLPEKGWLYWIFLSTFEKTDHIFALKFLWSISVAEQYVFFFFLINFLFKKVSILPSLFFLGAYFMHLVFLEIYNIRIPIVSQGACFGIGILAGHLFFKHKKELKISIISITTFLTLLLAIVFFEASFYRLPLSMFYASLILLVAVLPMQKLIEKVKLLGVFNYWGKYTYGLYVYSGFVITFQRKILFSHNPFFVFFFNLLLLILIAWLSYNYFEKPILKLKKYFR